MHLIMTAATQQRESFDETSSEITRVLANVSMAAWDLAKILGWSRSKLQWVTDKMIANGDLFFKFDTRGDRSIKILSTKPFPEDKKKGVESYNGNDKHRIEIQGLIIETFVDVSLYDLKDYLSNFIDFSSMPDDVLKKIDIGKGALEMVLRLLHFDGLSDPRVAEILGGGK